NRHLYAKRAEEVRELDSDRAGADHEQLLWKALVLEHRAVGVNAIAVDLDARNRTGTRACGDDDVLESEFGRFSSLIRNDEFVPALGRAVPNHDFDTVLAHQEADAAEEFSRHVARARNDFGEVDADRADLKSELSRAVHIVVELRRAKERL